MPKKSSRNERAPNADEFAAALKRMALHPKKREMLRAHYAAPNRRITTRELARAVGYKNYRAANLHYGLLGQYLAEEVSPRALPHNICALLHAERPMYAPHSLGNDEWLLEMNPDLARALELIEWV